MMRDIDIKGRCFLILAFVISVLYAFTVSQVDCNTIVTWGYDLINSIREGCLRNYPVYTYEVHGMPTNYNLLPNVVTALWLLPAYLVGELMGLFDSIIIYDIWYKVLIICVHIIDLILFYKVLARLDFDAEGRVRGLIYYMLSTALLITVIGKGQIDIYSVTLVLLASLFMMDSRFILAAIFFGVALCIKPFVILLIVPLYLLLISTLRGKVITYGIITLVPYVIDVGFTRILMPRYFEMKAVTSQMFKEAFGTSRIEEIFALRINHMLVFLSAAIIICFICLRLGRSGEVRWSDYLFYPTLMYICYGIFVSDSCYWFVVIIPALIIMGLKIRSIEDFELMYAGSNLGVVIYIYNLEGYLRPGSNYTIFERHGIYNDNLMLFDILSPYRTEVYRVGATLFMLCMLMICVVFRLEDKKLVSKVRAGADDKSIYSRLCFLAQYIPALIYLIINFATMRSI